MVLPAPTRGSKSACCLQAQRPDPRKASAVFQTKESVSYTHLLFALTLANKPNMLVISVAITSFIGEHSTSWNQMMAMGVISIIPVLLIFIFLQNYLVGGER